MQTTTMPTSKTFEILVQDRRSGEFRLRTVLTFDEPVTANYAVRQYVVSARRPQSVRKGEATSKSGKRFRAVIPA